MTNFKTGNQKDKRMSGPSQEFINATNAAVMNYQIQNPMGSGLKMNPKAITKSNFYQNNFQNNLNLQQTTLGNLDAAVKSPQNIVGSGQKRFNFNSTMGFSQFQIGNIGPGGGQSLRNQIQNHASGVNIK